MVPPDDFILFPPKESRGTTWIVLLHRIQKKTNSIRTPEYCTSSLKIETYQFSFESILILTKLVAHFNSIRTVMIEKYHIKLERPNRDHKQDDDVMIEFEGDREYSRTVIMQNNLLQKQIEFSIVIGRSVRKWALKDETLM